MAEVSAHEVNALLRSVKAIMPDDTPNAGDMQLTLIAGALCIAARSCGVDRDALLENVGVCFDEAEKMGLVPIDGTAG